MAVKTVVQIPASELTVGMEFIHYAWSKPAAAHYITVTQLTEDAGTITVHGHLRTGDPVTVTFAPTNIVETAV